MVAFTEEVMGLLERPSICFVGQSCQAKLQVRLKNMEEQRRVNADDEVWLGSQHLGGAWGGGVSGGRGMVWVLRDNEEGIIDQY